jgi:hypothetical protein
MKRFSAIILSAVAYFAASCSGDGGWTYLIDKDLSNFRPYQSYTGEFSQGRRPVDEEGNVRQPVGYDVNLNDQWTVIEQDGELVIRNSGEYYGCLSTLEEYSDYHFSMQFMFGKDKYEPRLNRTRDSGLQYHAVGECGVRDPYFSWMTCHEIQLMESGTNEGEPGDYHSNAGANVEALSEGPVQGGFGKYVAKLDGTGTWNPICRHGTWAYCAAEDKASPAGQWTQLDLYCFGDKAVHVINGNVVMVLRKSQYWDGEKDVPLTKGKISLQSEAAEIFYKGLKIQPIKALPKEFEKYYE